MNRTHTLSLQRHVRGDIAGLVAAAAKRLARNSGKVGMIKVAKVALAALAIAVVVLGLRVDGALPLFSGDFRTLAPQYDGLPVYRLPSVTVVGHRSDVAVPVARARTPIAGSARAPTQDPRADAAVMRSTVSMR